MSKKINLVIIGAGKIAEEHLKVISTLKELMFSVFVLEQLLKQNLSNKYKVKNYSTDAVLVRKIEKLLME